MLSVKPLYVNIFHILTYLILTTTLRERYYYIYHFTDEKTETQNDCHLFKILQPINLSQDDLELGNLAPNKQH